ncbi:MAG: DUF748 domain-containing protein [Arcobacteraceae bacterium]|nr:DUF748 domain-containing protein [Arcobacteraceae bacterium]
MKKIDLKKIVKIPLYGLGLVGLYGVVGFYGVPYAITKVAPKKIEELTKSDICEIQKATFNPFSFELNLYNLKLTTPTNSKLVSIGHINLKFNLFATLKEGKIYIENILIDTPIIGIEKYKNGEFNFTYLLALSKTKEKKESNEPLKLHIDSFKILNGDFSFDDQSEMAKLKVDTKAINFVVLNLDTTPNFNKETKINLSSAIQTTGLVDFQSNIAIALNGSFDKKDIQTFKFNVKDFALDIKKMGYKNSSSRKPFSVDVDSVQVKSEKFNTALDTPFGVNLSIENIAINEVANGKKIFGLEGIDANIKELNLPKKELLIDKITLLNPSFTIKRLSSGKIDLEDFIPQSKGTKSQEKEETQKSNNIWNYTIENIALENGQFNIYDEVPNPKVAFAIDRFHFEIEGLSSNKENNIHLSLSSYLNQNSKVGVQTDLKLSTMNLAGKFNVEKIALPLFNPYIKDFTSIEPIRGKISTSGKFDYLNKLVRVDGKIALDDFVINDARDNSVLFGWNKIGVTPFVFNQKENSLKIKQLNIDGLYTNVKLDKSKVLNFSGLSKNQNPRQEVGDGENNNTTTTNEKQLSAKNGSKNDFYFELQKLYIQKSSTSFSDESLPLPFKTYITNLNGTVNNISSKTDTNASIALKGNVDDIGTALIDGKVYVANPKDFAKVKVVFENLELKQYTPYSMEFLGYEIDDGRLFLNLDYALNNKIVQSSNRVSINQIKLGKEKAGGSPWPLGLAVAILENSDGKIELDLPIEGNIDEPDFKYGKMVWKTIGNVFTKAVTSPFKMLGSLLGMEDNSIEDIEFLYGESTIMPSEVKKLDSVASILSKRKKLQLSVSGKYDSVQDTRALQIKQLLKKASKIKSAEMEFESLDGITLEIAEKLADKRVGNLDKEKNNLKEKYKNEKEFEKEYLSFLVVKLIDLEIVKESDLITLANNRTKAITEYFANKYQINDITIEKEEKINLKENGQNDKIKSKLGLSQKQ